MQSKTIKSVTPVEEYVSLNQDLGVPRVILKREDKHPYGSHKGRSIPVMIDLYIKEGFTEFAISSSGNAAIAGALYIKEINNNAKEKVKLEILVGNKINKSKFEKIKILQDENIKVSQVEKPLQSLFERTKNTRIKSLRQSTDDNALLGYEILASEISEIEDVKRVYIATSSGTTAEALAKYFIKNNLKIEVNIIQTSSCHPIVSDITADIPKNEVSIADAIVDKTAQRKDDLLKLIKDLGGYGFIASNDDIRSAQDIVKKSIKESLSTNAVLSIVGIIKDSYTRELPGSSVCIISGE